MLSRQVEAEDRLTFPLPLKNEILKFGLSELVQELGGLDQVLFLACEKNVVNLFEVLLAWNSPTYSKKQHFAQKNRHERMIDIKRYSKYSRLGYRTAYFQHCNPDSVFTEPLPHVTPDKASSEPCRCKTGSISALDKALFVAIDHISKDVINLLFDYGSSLDSRNQDGHTPLGLSVKLDNNDILKLLISHSNYQLNDLVSFEGR